MNTLEKIYNQETEQWEEVFATPTPESLTPYETIVNNDEKLAGKENVGVAAQLISEIQFPDSSKWENGTIETKSIKYGRLYNWYAATDPRGIAPAGWHVPSTAELTALINFVGDNHNGNKLLGIVPDRPYTDDFGFKGVLGGIKNTNSGFIEMETYMWLWSKDMSYVFYPADSGNSMYIQYQGYDSTITDNYNLATDGLSIRLIKDNSINEGDIIIDGDTYNTVTIGNQVWLQQNLAVKHYQNGNLIGSDFSGTVGAVAAYDNNESNVYDIVTIEDPTHIQPEPNSNGNPVKIHASIIDGLETEINNSHIQGTDSTLKSPDGTKSINLDDSGTLHVENISQVGTSYETHAEQISTTKNEIILRDNAVAGLAVGETVGFRAKLYDGVHDGLLVVDGNGVTRVGDEGDTQPLATREETPIDGGWTFWDALTSKFKTVAIDVASLVSHIADSTIHVTTTLKNTWNAKLDGTKAAIEGLLTGVITTHSHTVAKSDVGLGNVDNTSDLNKPASTAQLSKFVVQNGGIIYHTLPWINIGTVSTSGINVTGIGTSFTAAMVGAKIIVNNEERIIATYVSATSITINSAFSQNYNSSVFAIYSKSIAVGSDGYIYMFNSVGAIASSITPSGNTILYNRIFIGGITQAFSQSTPNVIEINSGINGSYRDLAIRYIYQSIGTSTGDAVGDIRHSNQLGVMLFEKCTVASGTKGSGTWISLFSVNAQGVLLPIQTTTALAPTYVKGGIYFDTTLNKMKIGGATTWETLTSV